MFRRLILIIIMCLNTSSRLEFTAEDIGVKINMIQSVFARVRARMLHRMFGIAKNLKKKFVSFFCRLYLRNYRNS